MRRVGRVLLAGLAMLVMAGSAIALEKLSGPEIHRLFEGNTVAGQYYIGGGKFTEWHAPDGHAYGHNGREINTDACWTTLNDHVCYYYGPPDKRTVHCFTVHRSGELFILRSREGGNINALAYIARGNPENHSDRGRPWICDGLISQAPMTPRAGRLMAAWTPRPAPRRP
jgi:hypothetical protein